MNEPRNGNPGRLLTKEQMMQAVWGDTAVEEANLADHVFAIRKALGDTAENRHLIETVPKSGYRFTGSVETVASSVPHRENGAIPEATPAHRVSACQTGENRKPALGHRLRLLKDEGDVAADSIDESAERQRGTRALPRIRCRLE